MASIFNRVNTVEHFDVRKRTIFYALASIVILSIATPAYAESGFPSAISYILGIIIGPLTIFLIL